MCNVYLGIAEGALADARDYTLTQTKPWMISGVESSRQDPYILAKYGELFVAIQAAQSLTNAAAESLQESWGAGEAITAKQRGKCALDVAGAKLTTTKTGLEVTSRMFELRKDADMLDGSAPIQSNRRNA